MRYAQTENTWLLGNLPPGKTVTIVIVDIDTDNAPILLSNECVESTHIPGLYIFDVLTNLPVTSYKNFAYEMSDGENAFRGKFVYGGALPADVKSINEEPVTNINDLSGKTDILNAIDLLNDLSPSELVSYLNSTGAVLTEGTLHSFLDNYNNKGEWGKTLSEQDFHDYLDSYENKAGWADKANMQPVLDAIANLDLISLIDIENSTILAKETTLNTVAGMVSLIPTTDNSVDLTPVLTAISNLNDVSASEVRAQFNVVDFKDKNTEAEIHAWLDSYNNKDDFGKTISQTDLHTALDTYSNKDDWKAAVTNIQPVLNAIAELNDIDLATIEASTILAKQATLNNIINAIANIEVNAENVNVDLSPVLTAIEALNDVSALEVRAAFNEADFKDKNTQSEIHLWLDNYTNKEAWGKVNTESEMHQFLNSYTNKNLWQAQVDLSPVLNAITSLNDIDLATIEASTVLVKQTQLQAIADAVALIPTSSITDLTPVLNAIANLNDVTPQDVRNAFNPAEFKDKNTEAEIHNWLDSYANKDSFKDKNTQADIHAYLDAYTNKDDWKASLNLQPVLNAIASLNDIDLATIESSATLAKEASVNSLITLINGLSVSGGTIDLAPVLTAISNLNDITAADVRAAFNEADFKDKNTQAEIHQWLDNYANKETFGTKASEADIHLALDSYANKSDWKANAINIQPLSDALSNIQLSINNVSTDVNIVNTAISTLSSDVGNIPVVDLAPVVNSINALNDLSLAEIESSLILAKQSTLQQIVNSVAQIPTTDTQADLTPVLDAISNLNDVTPQQVRDAFNEADFKDKNTQAEIHQWLDTYANKDDWKGLTASQEATVITTNNIINTISTTLSNVQSSVNALPTISDIESSNVATGSDVTNAVTSIIDAIPALADIRNEMINVQFGGLEIANNQMIIKDKNGIIIAIFDLFDQNGNPTMCSVFTREVVS
jgi:hypothetical protein